MPNTRIPHKYPESQEFITWGPLVEDENGNMRPCPKRKGREFNAFVNALRRHGYQVEWKELRGCDYGAPTIRKRLFLIARRDGMPIVWPAPTHGDPASAEVKSKKLKPWRTAAECIDFTIPCPSIFERDRPLAEATMRRIARGIMRYVVNAAEPFIVKYYGQKNEREFRGSGLHEPLHTQSTENRFALVSPTLVQTGYGERPGQAPRAPGLHKPLGTCVDGQKHALVSAFLAKHYGGNETPGWPLPKPISAVTAKDHHALVTSNLVKLRGTSQDGQPTGEPLHTVSAQGTHFAEVRAFLIKYYGSDQDPRLEEPMHTIPTKDRFGLVTVAGEEYAIADIGMRMLSPRELYRAQGFPENYIIGDRPEQGLSLPKHAQVRMCGNSVCPPLAAALVRANVHELAVVRVA